MIVNSIIKVLAFIFINRWKPAGAKQEQHLRVAFQVRIKPGTYDVGPETIGAGRKPIDPRFSNIELEWSTKRRGVTVLTGLLVKMEEMAWNGPPW